MLFESEIGDTLVEFKSDSGFDDEYEPTDYAITTLVATGSMVTPEDGPMIVGYDVLNGYKWEIPQYEIGPNKRYDWLKKCYPRVLSGIEQRRGPREK